MTRPFVTESRLRVRYSETDRMGVAYHAHYLVWCEVGRTDYIRHFGTTYADLERQGLMLAVASAEIRYGASVRYDDAIVVHTWLEKVQSRALTFGYEVVADVAGRRLATARTKLIALGPDHTPCTLPAHLLRKFRGGHAQ